MAERVEKNIRIVAATWSRLWAFEYSPVTESISVIRLAEVRIKEHVTR